MKFSMIFGVLFLVPFVASAEDIGFSYQSSDGTIYTSTTAPAYCKRYYEVKPGHPAYPGTAPCACIDPQFTTSRGSLKNKRSQKEDSYDDYLGSDSSDGYAGGKKKGRFEAEIPPAAKKREKSWWEWRSDPDEPLAHERFEDGKVKRPPLGIGERYPRARQRDLVEVTLTPAMEGDSDEELEKKDRRIRAQVPPAPRSRRDDLEIYSGRDGKNGHDGKDGKDGDDDVLDEKKNGRIVAKLPPAPPARRVTLPPSSDSDFNPADKKNDRPVVVLPPRPSIRKDAGSIRLDDADSSAGRNGKNGKDGKDWDDDGTGQKKNGRIMAVSPPVPPARTQVPVDPNDGSSWDFSGKGKKGDRFIAVTPPAPVPSSRFPVLGPPDNSDADIEGMRKRLQPIRVVPPSGKIKVYEGTNDHKQRSLTPEEAFCLNNTQPSDMIPGQPTFVDISRKLAEQLPAPKLKGDKGLLDELIKKTPEQAQCAADAPKSPSRIVLAFDSFASFDYEDYYKKNDEKLKKSEKALPEKDAQAFKKKSAFSEAARKEDRQVPGVHWKYYPKENQEKEELSPAVRCAYELATKGYTNKKGQKVYNTISLVSHSFGADAVARVANTLKKLGVRVDLVLTTDPRQSLDKTNRQNFQKSPSGNIDRWVNFYQSNDPIIRGFPVDGAENVNISAGGAWHGQAPQDALVRARASKEMMELPRCKSDLTGSVYQQAASCD